MAVVNARGVRVARLLQLLLALGAGRCPNARELAEACEVSRRTIYRDLELLELAGVPVRYRPDRQGYELPPGFGLTPPALEEWEAAALLVLARQWGDGDGLGMARAARSAGRKIFLALSPDVRDRVRGLVDAVGPEAEPAATPASRQSVYEALIQSLGRGLQVRAWFVGDDGVSLEATKFSPYRLACGPPGWRLIGRSTFHRGIRDFSVASIQRAVLTEDPYAIPPRFAAAGARGPAGADEDGIERRGAVRLRLSGRVAAEFLESTGRLLRDVERREDGEIVARMDASTPEEVLARVMPLGDQVEILGPPELRHLLAGMAARMARIHGAPSPEDPSSGDAREPG